MIRIWPFCIALVRICHLDLVEQALVIKKNKNTFAKMMRERKKKQKADEKRQRKLERNATAEASSCIDPSDDLPITDNERADDTGTNHAED